MDAPRRPILAGSGHDPGLSLALELALGLGGSPARADCSAWWPSSCSCPVVVTVYGDVDRFWIARFRDYDRIINGLTDPQDRRNLKYVNQALLYLIRFWREHYRTEAEEGAAQ